MTSAVTCGLSMAICTAVRPRVDKTGRSGHEHTDEDVVAGVLERLLPVADEDPTLGRHVQERGQQGSELEAVGIPRKRTWPAAPLNKGGKVVGVDSAAAAAAESVVTS
jgi:hypothetical protein